MNGLMTGKKLRLHGESGRLQKRGGFFFCKGYESNISSVVTTHKEENFDLLLSSGNIFSLQKNP